MADTLPKGLKWRNGVLWIDLYDEHGKRHRESTRTADKALATQRLRDVERALYTGTHTAKGTNTATVEKAWTLDAAYRNAMLLHWAAKKDRETTALNYAAVCEVIPRDTPVAAIGIEHCTALIQRQLEKGNSLATANRKLAVLSKLLKLSVQWGKLDRTIIVPFNKEAKGREREFSRDEQATMFKLAREDAANPWLTDALTILFYTGCRLGELLALRPRDVTATQVTFADPKNGHPRTLPLVRPFWDAAGRLETRYADVPAALARWVKLTPKVRENVFYDRWNGLRVAMGLLDDPEFVPHACRHTCCTRLLRLTGDVRRVQLWLGHTSIQSTMRYQHVSTADLSAHKVDHEACPL
jgi:integrase